MRHPFQDSPSRVRAFLQPALQHAVQRSLNVPVFGLSRSFRPALAGLVRAHRLEKASRACSVRGERERETIVCVPRVYRRRLGAAPTIYEGFASLPVSLRARLEFLSFCLFVIVCWTVESWSFPRRHVHFHSPLTFSHTLALGRGFTLFEACLHCPLPSPSPRPQPGSSSVTHSDSS